jgi:peptidoglycan/xylan/chitin deacetylase (PgdA/CDA1 family)
MKFSAKTFRKNRSALTILTFHRVMSEPHPIYFDWPTIAEFKQKIKWLKSYTTVLPLHDALDAIFLNQSSGHFGAITFDDGYKDNFQNALPALREEGIKATFFVATDYLENRILFDDLVTRALVETKALNISCPQLNLESLDLSNSLIKRHNTDRILETLKYLAPTLRDQIAREIAEELGLKDWSHQMMDASDIVALKAAGMEIGSHSHNHLIPQTVSNDVFKTDLQTSIKILENLLQVKPRFFAFPNGVKEKDFNEIHMLIVKDLGFEAAFSTDSGIISPESNRYCLRRSAPWPTNRFRMFIELLRQRYLDH